ncbi:MAG: Eco57I restriction-modification methylase domain-containing protein [Deltaproteobacteria bacterium]|jgi:hypothetical protein|nr:Eco57I restriction-modification methylase domain-containing protein [Deltaproteobacteria bacterium]
MIISKLKFSEFINSFKLKELFLELGWDNDRTKMPVVKINDLTFEPQIIADKNGFKIIECQVSNIPTYDIRMKLANTVNNLFHENLLIFFDTNLTEQLWLYYSNYNSQKYKSEVRFTKGQDVERLYQRTSGMIFEIDEQDNITIVDVVQRVRKNFAINAEKVTKKFYEAFKKHHAQFLKLIDGIDLIKDKEWYASIMMNRLMFCYFMQRRGFLNKDQNYLRNKLEESKKQLGKNQFYSFYRSFLMILFQKGFGTYHHSLEIRTMIGDVPYLNGGIFDIHLIEQNYPNIDIPDNAFENIFNLFDLYEWHLDTRDCATGNEISPDVLGYIFEKYINDRSLLGAYYTQEDITSYISRSSIIPWLLEKVKEIYPSAFEKNGIVWTFLRNSGDAYIFESIKHGCKKPLPEFIRLSLDPKLTDLIERRKVWNTPALPDYGLPTEIWREVIERRNFYENITELISLNQITEIFEFIVNNIDLSNFIEDLLNTIDDPKFIHAFYSSLENITILDPTCGSGAFLFSALSVLESLYGCCLCRMEDYLNNRNNSEIDRRTRRFFDEKIESMDSNNHPNKSYFIYKSIILNNIYGVDIMHEAVEITKLRLFLKLVSTVQPDYNSENIGIEPLPDIDFNIKSGNTLIGYANELEVDAALSAAIMATNLRGEIKDAMLQMSKATALYKKSQLDSVFYRKEDLHKTKSDLLSRQTMLKEKLDNLLISSDFMCVDKNDLQNIYQPFHWVCEFYAIIVENQGFDVILGNPPYLEMRDVKYEVKNYEVIESNNVHSLCIERAFRLCNNSSNISMIIPLSIVSTKRMKAVRTIIETKRIALYANFSWRPGRLFQAVNRALTIFTSLAAKDQDSQFTTKYIKWNSENRDNLFQLLHYTLVKNTLPDTTYWLPKLNGEIDNILIDKIRSTNKLVGNILRRTKHTSGIIYYKSTGGLYWKIFTNFPPKFYINGKEDHSSRESKIFVDDDNQAIKLIALFSSSTFWFWYTVSSTLRDLNPAEINQFYLPNDWEKCDDLIKLGKKYMKSLVDNCSWNIREQKTVGVTKGQKFKISASKHIIDQIDTVLAKHYGFTQEELDYIINYDIKYRMSLGHNYDNDE